MLLDNLTIGQVKEIANLFSGTVPQQINLAEARKGERVLVRTYSAGVHIGTLGDVNGEVLELTDTRRLWSWTGAFTLSTVAQQGVNSAKMPDAIPSIVLRNWIEIIPLSERANKQLSEMKSHG